MTKINEKEAGIGPYLKKRIIGVDITRKTIFLKLKLKGINRTFKDIVNCSGLSSSKGLNYEIKLCKISLKAYSFLDSKDNYFWIILHWIY